MKDVSVSAKIEYTINLLTDLGCGSDIIQKDLELDKSRVDEYIRLNLHDLKLFPASDLTGKDKILLPHWAYGFVLRSRQWGMR
jgi:hypothetical protein